MKPLGREIVTLVEGIQQQGTHRIHWNGKDSIHQTVATGVYLYRLKTDKLTQTKKLVMMR